MASYSRSASVAGHTREKTYFEQQREELMSEIAMSFEHVLANINKLNRSLEAVIALGNEFSSVEALWSTFENVMAKDEDEEGQQEQHEEGDEEGEGQADEGMYDEEGEHEQGEEGEEEHHGEGYDEDEEMGDLTEVHQVQDDQTEQTEQQTQPQQSYGHRERLYRR
ncbi:DASH complex subunit Dad1-domain-containing protein [Cladorrhinum sp. PSN259]|nr:DASH complex subunit Dad1-domain-containing protein [Cladorrhinum sp. PSN259]